MSHVAFVALGSNLGDSRETLDSAVCELDEVEGVRVVGRSTWHETDPVGGPSGQPQYLNGVVRCETTLSARALLSELQRIEQRHGRVRELPNAPRTLDLDLLLFDHDTVQDPDLIVPHPRMEERLFVLEPLAEIAPDRVLEVSGRTVLERVDELRRQSL